MWDRLVRSLDSISPYQLTIALAVSGWGIFIVIWLPMRVISALKMNISGVRRKPSLLHRYGESNGSTSL